jgi:hypothetical protein
LISILFRAGQVSGGYTEAATRDLFDRAVGKVAIGAPFESLGIFAAFAAVRFATDPVHGDCQRLVRFR